MDDLRRYYIFSFLRGFYFFTPVIVPFYQQTAGLNQTEIQSIQAWFLLWIFLLEVPTGAVADIWGRKNSVMVGCLLVSLGCAVYGISSTLPQFLIAETIFAAGICCQSGADNALVFEQLRRCGLDKESPHYFGRIHSYFLAGIMVSAPIGGLIAGAFGVRAPMLLTALPMLLAALVLRGVADAPLAPGPSERSTFLRTIKEGWHALVRRRRPLWLAMNGIAVAICGYFVIWLYQPLAMSHGIPVAYFGLAAAGMCLTEIIIARNFASLEKFFGSKGGTLSAMALLTAVGFLAPVLIGGPVSSIIFIIVGGGFGLTRYELMTSYLNRLLPSKQRATALSMVSMLQRLLLVPLNPLVGLAADHSLRLALTLCTIPALLAAAGLMLRGSRVRIAPRTRPVALVED